LTPCSSHFTRGGFACKTVRNCIVSKCLHCREPVWS
jgi:hypothetical protein